MARIKLQEWCKQNKVPVKLSERGRVILGESPALLEVAERAVHDAMCDALCDEGCVVEPDGRCSHGAPSLLLALGVI